MRRFVKVALGTAGAFGLLAAFNDWARWNVGPVPRWANGEPHFYQWREGAIYYEAAGPRDAPPLLLLHGINAAASSYEMRRIFPALAETYRVYLPDLLGYGRSERPGIRYSADTFVDLWSDFVRDVAAGEAGRPVHVIASSLSAAHVVAAAARHPERFGHLLLVCPTGIETLATDAGLGGKLLQALLRLPVLGTALFNALVTRVSLAGFLRRQVYADPDNVTTKLVDDYYLTSHQPGAKWVPAAFVSGGLNCNIVQAFQRLPNPVSLAWGRAATVTPVEQAEAFRALRPAATLEVFEHASLLPHDEQPAAFVRWAQQKLAPA